ncbi:MAG: electron transport complex subunit RsxC, partial [Oleispira antarctica]|nr:electron transport complex subunit RsxC [Oleispira antarctica]
MQTITLHSFNGGIHPQENKFQSTQTPIAQLPLPAQLVVPVGQHIGAPAEVIVAVGDRVLKGQLIAQPKGFVSAAIHAPTSGKVVAIEQRELPHSSGLEGICIIIDSDGEDTWLEDIANGSQAIANYLEADNDVLVNRIRDCGITGLGGAGFPTAVKMAVKGKHIETLIINAAECEPYITADDMLMRERALKAMRGIQILMKLTAAKNCLIGIEDNKPEAIKAMKDALHQVHGEHYIAVVTIPTKYPSGGEKQLIEILTGKEVPSGGIPAEIGIVCQNVGTCEAVYRA